MNEEGKFRLNAETAGIIEMKIKISRLKVFMKHDFNQLHRYGTTVNGTTVKEVVVEEGEAKRNAIF